MDIFEFINSKDIKAYLKSISYKFNSLEASWLIYQSGLKTLDDKLQAYSWVIENMPDQKIVERYNCTPRESLHETLKEYINIVKESINEFFNSDNSLYSMKYYYTNDSDWKDLEYIASNPNKLFEILKNEYEDDIKNIVKIEVSKRIIDSDEASYVLYSYNQKLMGISDRRHDRFVEKFFEGLWFKFPTPFKKGDILVSYDSNKLDEFNFTRSIFSMTNITPMYLEEIPKERKEKFINGPVGDVSDMNAWGYFLTKNGYVYHECMWNYMDLEYYRGEFGGYKEVISLISKYEKDEIDLPELLYEYHKVLNNI